MSSPHSLRIKTAGTEVETAPQGADPVDDSAVSPEQRNAPSESPVGRKAVAPLVTRPVEGIKGSFEILDAQGLVITSPILGLGAASALTYIFNGYVRGDGICLRHLQETFAGRCVPCLNGWMRHTFSVEAR